MSIFGKTREFIVEEKDLVAILDLVSRLRGRADVLVSSCGWAEEPTKWFIMFNSNDKVYNKIVKEITEIGKINLSCGTGCNSKLYVEIEP